MVLSIYFQAFDKNTLIQLNKAYELWIKLILDT